MALTDLPDWIDEQSRPPTVWFVKRLQANDTLATGSHQAGPYLPKEFLFAVFPALADPAVPNPRVEFDIYVDSQGDHRPVRAIWYNNELRGGTRNETRITGFGGARSDLLDPESTGAVAVLAFDLSDQPVPACHIWVCRDDTESDLVEASIGRVDPGTAIIWVADGTPEPDRFRLTSRRAGRPAADRRPGAASTSTDNSAIATASMTPPVETLVRRSAALQSLSGQSVDVRILRRHEVFVELFDSAEQETYCAKANDGFPDIRSLLEVADKIRRGRQTRSVDALAFQLRDLLEEEGFVTDETFSFRPRLGQSRPPDFLFPSLAAYEHEHRPASSLAVLFVEQTVRDRWRTIAGSTKIKTTHVLTLQRGVSETQFSEMLESGIALVVPARLHDTYPAGIRSQLMSLESFTADVRHLTP